MQGPNSIIVPLNVPVLAAGATWPNSAQPTSQSPMFKMNNNQINDAIRVLIFAIYGLTLNILESNDNSTWTSLYSEANTAGQLLDSGWINPTMRYFQVQIVNGATQQGGDIYANAQQVNPAPIDARLALYMQEPETVNVSGGSITLNGSNVTDAVLYNAVAASRSGAGSVINVSGKSTLELIVFGDATAAGTLSIYGAGTSGNYGAIEATLLSTFAQSLTIAAWPQVSGTPPVGAAIYQVPVAGLSSVYLPLAWSAGHITVEYGLM